jgi:hypothetical protein
LSSRLKLESHTEKSDFVFPNYICERKVLRKIFGRTKEQDGTWRIKINKELD